MLYEYLYQYRYLKHGPDLNLMRVLISLFSDGGKKLKFPDNNY
jgi:hypothetical protein